MLAMFFRGISAPSRPLMATLWSNFCRALNNCIWRRIFAFLLIQLTLLMIEPQAYPEAFFICEPFGFHMMKHVLHETRYAWSQRYLAYSMAYSSSLPCKKGQPD